MPSKFIQKDTAVMSYYNKWTKITSEQVIVQASFGHELIDHSQVVVFLGAIPYKFNQVRMTKLTQVFDFIL